MREGRTRRCQTDPVGGGCLLGALVVDQRLFSTFPRAMLLAKGGGGVKGLGEVPGLARTGVVSGKASAHSPLASNATKATAVCSFTRRGDPLSLARFSLT